MLLQPHQEAQRIKNKKKFKKKGSYLLFFLSEEKQKVGYTAV